MFSLIHQNNQKHPKVRKISQSLRVFCYLVTATSAAIVSSIRVIVVTAVCQTAAAAVIIEQTEYEKDHDYPNDPGEVA